MAKPASTPGIPGAPNSTPTSTTQFSLRGSLRAPIYNPYDKFTQTEFDSWIGDITGALKRALGHEVPEPPAEPNLADTTGGDVSAYDEEGPEDSFAEVVARRKAKGKERAAEEAESEGGNEAHPILLSSDQDEDEDEDDENEAVARDQWDDGWDEAGIDTEVEEGEGEGEEGEVDYEDEGEEYLQESSGDEGQPSLPKAHRGPEDAIELSSDDEEADASPAEVQRYASDDDDSEEDSEDGIENVSSTQGIRPRQRQSIEQVEEKETIEDDLLEVYGDEDIIPSQERTQSPDISDPWVGPNTFAEDLYTGGDMPPSSSRGANPHLLPLEGSPAPTGNGDNDDFPPTSASQPVDITDPWAGPRAIVDDLYTGGDLRGDPSGLSPSHLTPLVSTPQNGDSAAVTGSTIVPSEESLEASYTRSHEIEVNPLPSASVDPQEPSLLQQCDDESEYDDLYADLDAPMGGAPSLPEDRDEFDVSNIMKPMSPSPNFRTPHDELSTQRASLTGHVDWNWPPAFSKGRPATHTGHLATPGAEVYEISDDDEDEGGVEEVELPTALTSSNVDIPSVPPQQDPLFGDEVEGSTATSHPDPSGPSLALKETQVSQVSEVASEENRQPSPSIQEEVDMYTELNSFYMEPEITNSSSFEPLSEDIDFGDLPAPLSREKSVGERHHEQISDNEVPVDRQEKRILEGDILGADNEAGDQIVHGTFSMPADISDGQPYVVLEMEDEIAASPTEGVDATSYAGDSPNALANYSVEEPVTEGKTSEDSELHLAESQNLLDTADSTLQNGVQENEQSPKMPDALSTIREITSHSANLEHVVPENDSEDESPPSWRTTLSRKRAQMKARKSSLLSRPDADIPESEASVPDAIVQESSRLIQPEIFVRASSEDSIASSSQSVPAVVVSSPTEKHEDPSLEAPQVHEPPRMLESGIPMPVSANPGVPDPASCHNSPTSQSPVPSEAHLDRGATPGIEQTPQTTKLSAKTISEGLPPSLLRHIKDRSISGLFTPMSDGTASPDSSDGQEEANTVVKGNEDPEDGSPEAPGLSLLISGDDIEPICLEPTQGAETQVAEGEPVPKANTDTSAVNAQAVTPPVSVNEQETPLETDATKTLPEPSQVSATQQSDSQNGTQRGVSHTERVHDVDDDAEGELDPDYHDDRGRSSKDVSEKKDCPEGAEAKPSEVTETQVPEVSQIAESSVEVERPKTPVEAHAALPQPGSQGEGDEPIAALPPKDGAATVKLSDAPTEEPRPLKRKRASPPPTPKRSARLSSLRNQAKMPAPKLDIPSKNSKGKEKEKVVQSDSDDDDKEVRSMLSTQGTENISASKTRGSSQGRATSTQPSSRSSSVGSSVPEQHVPILPLFHAHGARQKPEASQVQRQGSGRGSTQPIRRQESLQPPKTKSRSPSIGPFSASQPNPRNTASGFSTRATRSNCRFHKISIPIVDGGPRIFFIVPGCSLGKAELLEEEEIEDHGVLEMTEDLRLVPDVEGLDFSLYLVAVLRQLVATDYLRENEVFYLPQPGEDIRRRSKRQPKPTLTIQEATSARTASLNSPRQVKAPKRSPTKVAPLKADSISTASGSRDRRTPSKGQRQTSILSTSSSLSDIDLTDSDEERKTSKRPKPEPPVPSETQAPPAAPPPSPTVSKKPTTRRTKRLGADALAYKPDDHHSSEDSSEDEANAKVGPRKRTRKRGTKRTRESVGVSGDEVNDRDTENVAPKKRRVRQNTGGSAATKSST